MRLIDADMAREDMLFEMCGTGYQYNAMSVIDRQPTVDAVEVVRCKDCYKFDKFADGLDSNGYCDKWHNNVPHDGYCHYGERKEVSE